ncbi:MAG: acetylglutamate kinase [Verrucomicrobiales bacterium]|nr:acetylglutamate kinase [Verrucomicrobiales bacterium]|tara:strand:- start:50 stop:925 length:876 start_codon:yes stop_codon:yes gene_type:complete
MEDLISKAATLLEALPYIQKFRSAKFVVKYGGSFMDSPDEQVRQSVARDVVFLEAVQIKPTVVHGGGKAISRALGKSGIETRFEQGLRVTDAKSVEVVDDVLSRQLNPEIVRMINSLGGKAQGFSGTEIFTCKKLDMRDPDGNPVDIGYVGQVTGVNTGPLLECLEKDYVPVISPTALGDDGHVYNCNADVAAAHAAIALQARRLVFMSDVPGLMEDPNDDQTVIPHLQISQVDGLKQKGIVAKGMIPKVDSAVEAIRTGVDKVSFVDGRLTHSVLLEIFTDKGVGTEIVL